VLAKQDKSKVSLEIPPNGGIFLRHEFAFNRRLTGSCAGVKDQAGRVGATRGKNRIRRSCAEWN